MRLAELDGLRGFLAVWVVIVHLVPAAGYEMTSLGIFSNLFSDAVRVQIFCAISGFAIFSMMASRPEPYSEYLVGRLLRIYPVFLLAFVLSVAMSGVAHDALLNADFSGPKNADRLDTYNNSFAYLPAHILAHLTLLHGIIPEQFLPSAATAFLGQAWNISTEVQFYVVAPLLFYVLHQSAGWKKYGLIFVILLALLVGQWWPNFAAVSHFAIYFAAGIASYYAARMNWDFGWFNVWTLCAASIALFAADNALGIWLFVFGSALLVRDRNRPVGPVARALRSRPMLFLGGVSYPLYLLHMIPLYGSMFLLNQAGLTQWQYLLCLAVLTFSIAIPFSWVVSTTVEKRFYRSRTKGEIPPPPRPKCQEGVPEPVHPSR